MPKLLAHVSEYFGFTLEEGVIYFCYLLSSVCNDSKAPKDRFKSLINCQTRSSATNINGHLMQGPNSAVLPISETCLNRVTRHTKAIYEEHKKCKGPTLPCVCNTPTLLDVRLSFCMQSKSCIFTQLLEGANGPQMALC